MRNILSKTASILLTLLLVTLSSFLLTRLSPVDPAEAYARMHTVHVSEEALAQLRSDMGLDDPLPVQYADWVKNALTLNFGSSFMTGNAVSAEFVLRIPRTVALVGLSALIQIVLVLLLGCIGYLTDGKMAGAVLKFLTLLGLCIPAFLFCIAFLDLFAIRLEWIPVLDSGMIYPALCAAVIPVSFFSKLLHGNLHGQMSTEWAEYARLRGLPEGHILLRHALPHSLAALTPNFMQMLGKQFAGIGLVEVVFSYRGAGSFIMEGIVHRDTPVIYAAVLFLSAAVLLTDLLSQLLLFWLNRYRSGRSAKRRAL